MSDTSGIDSLCITQDSREDWAKESAMMGKVYQHGRCNLAATADAEGADGFYVQRQLSTIQPGFIETAWTNFENGTYFCMCEDELWCPPSMAENVFNLAAGSYEKCTSRYEPYISQTPKCRLGQVLRRRFKWELER